MQQRDAFVARWHVFGAMLLWLALPLLLQRAAAVGAGIQRQVQDPEPPSWSDLANAPIAAIASVDRRGQRTLPTPLRIAYCRWSN